MASALGGGNAAGVLDVHADHIDTKVGRSTVSASQLDDLNPKPEPITTRRELYAWYAYQFGNNSAGPLSYAPLSKDLNP